MEKENYNIDDILSEVKKRREENEKEIKSKSSAPVKAESKQTPKQQAVPKKENEVQPKQETVKKQEPPKPQKAVQPPKEQPIPVQEKPEIRLEKEKPVSQEVKKIQKEVKQPIPAEKIKSEPKKSEPSDMVNLLELSERTQEDELSDIQEPVSDDNKGSKAKKRAKAIIITLVVLIVIAGIAAVLVANHMLNGITDNDNKNNKTTYSQWTGMDKLVENFDPINETEADELSSLQDMIKTWYSNGSPCSSSHVLNVMLIGEDTRGDEILDEGTRADSAIIVSVNIDTKQITLTSILRDTYAFWQKEKGNEQTGQFGKINGAMSIGDVHTYIECVESLYKIDIDNYVIVNFDSFEDIIDSLGGVTLELTEREINEINNHPKRYGNVTIEKTFEGSSGKLKLTGKQALAYCRIRKLDSDNKRADRQKTCLIEIFEETKDASTSKMIKVVNALLPYVKTGFSKGDVVKIAKYALSQNWLDFDIQMNTIPNARINEKGAGGIFYGAWCWKSDFPQDAYNLQMLLYGKSNITLAHKRVDVLKCAEKGFFKDGTAPVWETITNNNYGETTTLESTTKEEETTE